MADMMAIVSKAIFEKLAGKAPKLGTVLRMDRYTSANKALEPLSRGGKLYLVTVRPPDEALWLVAVLEQPEHDGSAWVAKPCATPITDISTLRSKIEFESGVGITDKEGTLGMSLQTPRALTAADTALLDMAAGVTREDRIPAPPSTPSPIGAATGERRGSLLDAILDHPESDEARQVYADQLITNNDPRGEYIMLDLALAGPLSIRKREQLAERRKEILRSNAPTWWPFATSQYRTHKGFLQALWGSWSQLQTTSAAFETEPITEVSISGVDDEATVEKLLKAPWLPRVRRLVLRGTVGDDGFAQLALSPSLANLRALNVTANELSADALRNMASALPRCDNLVLTGNSIGDPGIENLNHWGQLANVETLYLSGCEIESIDPLFVNTLGRLRKLTLSNNGIGDEGCAAIARCAPKLPALQHLELVRCGVSSASAKLLANVLPALRRLDVRYNRVESDDPRIRA